MDFLDIASIVFVCTAANHIGPIPDIEKLINRKLPIVGCIKCLTFWCVLIYCFVCFDRIVAAIEETPLLLAISLLSAWSAIWLDLFMGIIDHLYIKVYDTLYPTADEADTDKISADDTMPDVQEEDCDVITTNRTKNKDIKS